MTPVAYLRVYVPDDEAPVVEHMPPSGAGRVLVRGAYGVWFESLRDDAFVIRQRGRRLVCPRHPRLRMLEGLLAFRHAHPPGIGEVLVPETMARRAAAELALLPTRPPRLAAPRRAGLAFIPTRTRRKRWRTCCASLRG